MKNKLKQILCIALTVLIATIPISAHSGKTDGSGGHKDNQNKSGLGSYHYHCGGHPAHLHSGGVCPYSSTIETSAPTIDDYIILATSPTLSVGESYSIFYSFVSLDSSSTIQWSSSDPSIISVDNDGYITAHKEGTVTITAKSKTGSATTTATSKAIHAKSISLSNTSVEMKVGENTKISVSIYPDNTTDKNITWTSSDDKIAYIKDNTIYAVGKGMAVLTAKTTNGITETITVVVNEIAPEPIPVDSDGYISPFIDVDKTHSFYESVKYVNENGLMNGVSENEFQGDASLTRGMFVTILGRLSKVDTTQYTECSFSDVGEGAYYLPYVEWASENEIVLGYDDGTFRPDNMLTREEMYVIIYRYAKMVEDVDSVGAELIYADKEEISSWAEEAIKWATLNRLVNTLERVKPKDKATRFEVAQLLYFYITEH